MKKNTILVVDDDPDLCELIDDALSDKFVVQARHNAEDAQDSSAC